MYFFILTQYLFLSICHLVSPASTGTGVTVIIHVLRLEESRHTLELEVAARGQEFGQLVVRVRAAEARNLECEETIKRLEEARDDAEARVRSVGAALQSVTSRPATPSRCFNFPFLKITIMTHINRYSWHQCDSLMKGQDPF